MASLGRYVTVGIFKSTLLVAHCNLIYSSFSRILLTIRSNDFTIALTLTILVFSEV